MPSIAIGSYKEQQDGGGGEVAFAERCVLGRGV